MSQTPRIIHSLKADRFGLRCIVGKEILRKHSIVEPFVAIGISYYYGKEHRHYIANVPISAQQTEYSYTVKGFYPSIAIGLKMGFKT
jgi:hypothetical protein